jgi:hypothetical protein
MLRDGRVRKRRVRHHREAESRAREAVQDWELKAREQIRDLVARYNAYGDSGRFDEVLALFAKDATVEVKGYRTYCGREEIRELFTGAAGAKRRDRSPASPTSTPTPSPTPTPIWHHTSTLVIDLEDRALARGRCYFAVLTKAGLDHWGRYRDQYRAVEGGWLFAERRIRVDAMVPEGWADRNIGSLSAR